MSCKTPWTELQQLLGRALGHGRSAAGMLRLSLYLGRIRGHGEGCGHSVTERAASPSPPSQECHVTSLEPLPARQRGHPAAPPRRTSLSALNRRAAAVGKAEFYLRKGVKVRGISTAPLMFPLCSVLGMGPSPPSPEISVG